MGRRKTELRACLISYQTMLEAAAWHQGTLALPIWSLAGPGRVRFTAWQDVMAITLLYREPWHQFVSAKNGALAPAL